MEIFEIISSVCNVSDFAICIEYIGDLLARATLIFGCAWFVLWAIGQVVSDIFLRHNQELRDNVHRFFVNLALYSLFTFFALVFIVIPILSAISELIDFTILV